MAMGILSGKYHSSDDSGPPEARMNLFKGTKFLIFNSYKALFLSVLF
jgi:hypothetical protein